MERRVPAIQPARAARKSEWLRSALAHHLCPEPGVVENEIVVLATGIDQYIQEVFHHLAHPNQSDVVSAEDFTVLCAVLGLIPDGERGPGDGKKEEDEDEGKEVCSGLPAELSFKDFHSRLCGCFRVRAARDGTGGAAVRLPVTEETELVEREIRLRWPRVRRRKGVSFDLSGDHSRRAVMGRSAKCASGARKHDAAPDQQCDLEAAALRELVEDLRSALQGSDARCLALEVALKRERAHNAVSPAASFPHIQPATPSRRRGADVPPRPQERKSGVGGEDAKTEKDRPVQTQDTRDLLLRELNLIRSSRDGQLEEAIRFNQRLEEELHWAYQEVCRLKGVESTLRKENAEIRRRAEEARDAVRQGLQRVRLIQEEAQAVPALKATVSQLETQLQQYRSCCTCSVGPSVEPDQLVEPDDTCLSTECLQRAVEGKAASDEEEERGKKEEMERRREERGRRGDEERRREETPCCLMDVKQLMGRLHRCSKGCQDHTIHALLSQIRHHDNQLLTPSKDGRGRGWRGDGQLVGRGAELDKRGEAGGFQTVDTDCLHLSILQEKLTDALTLLLQLRNKNVSRRALGKILMDTLDMCTGSGHGPAQVLQVADALCVQLSSNELLQDGVKDGGRKEAGREKAESHVTTVPGRQSSSTNPLVISC